MSQPESHDDRPIGSIDPRILFTVGAVILVAAAMTLLVTGALNQSSAPAIQPTTAAQILPTPAAEASPPVETPLPAADAGHGELPDDVALESISVADAAERLSVGSALFVDMRESTEYTTGHIPGALGLFSDQLQSSLTGLPDDSIIIAYTDASRPDAGRRGAAILIQLGYQRVYLLDGGLEAWQAAGQPLNRP
jgi:rhodanese-related sulfurtransferase